ncbi:OsmC family protein [Leptospira bandrabouensis]|uniref:OsmC family protein n=1 Tax=Leptospira bandrabouensis TaxID=2484903 RepID=UPI001EE886E0|nr:OsmC family protein [Leptospira bandrabouensis]MCG6143424.1 OsmC family protein [Leptospira bandrabouensis]MCG6151534.1 OsmC family protein [Leptospira bandrabouensis]MCG6159084.1 OsmC family protein [Leptospira bandrabouensis]MCG6163018.1 OsmC family protein [Leptospira bandrabouensis]
MTNPDPNTKPKMKFHVETVRVDSHSSLSRCKSAEIALDTDMAGNSNAFNPAELLLSALSACIIKGVERVAPILHFQMKGIQVIVDGIRQDVPPKMESIRYQVIVDTDESEDRLHLLHENIKKYGTVFNTVAPGTDLAGEILRK